jgi:potassium-dependent mechanosensitive channel
MTNRNLARETSKQVRKTILTVCLIFFFCFTISGQHSQPQKDSSLSLSSGYEQLSARTKVIVAREFINSRQEFRAHQAVLQQGRTFVAIKNELERAKNFLKQGYSYVEIKEEIDRLTIWKKLAGEGVITGKDNFQTSRNLTATSILLNELLNRTNDRLKQIASYHKTLGQFQYKLDSLLMDSVLYVVPNDSVSLIRYFQRLVLLNKDFEPVEIPLKTALDSIEKLEIKVNMIKFSLESDIAETESQRKVLFDNIGIIETGTFGLDAGHYKSVEEVIAFSLEKAELVLMFYMINHSSSLILMFLFIIGIALFMIMVIRKSKDDLHGLSRPFASAILLVITVFQFFLPLPPFVFSGVLWLISGIALTVIMWNQATPVWRMTWLVFFGFFLFGFLGNLLLWQSAFERWTMLLYILSALIAGIFTLVWLYKQTVKEKPIMFFIVLMIAFELLALLNYASGGYNQAKTFMAGGIFTIIVAYFLFWTARIGNNTLQLSLHFFKGHEDDYHGESREKAKIKVPSLFLYILFSVGWFILISRNLYFYQTMFEPLGEALVSTRTIGAFTFTYNSIFIFFGILVLSGIISRIVSFLASDHTAGTGKSKAGGLGSWMLLIRITIITAGVLLAFVSAGIPMDKFAIILGALSVGIGFGLQTLINNLVSGVIIAFEKPINVGDIVEITGQVGKMKSIGIRSSVVTTWDGADVIIPNGDLLNQHLVNWTLGSSKRRFNLLLGVAYGTDLQRARQLLLDLMDKDQRILKYPEPIVLANEFNTSSVDLNLKFWVGHFSVGFDVKSDLILAIDLLFRENGIQIPFPQHDVHIRSTTETTENEDPGAGTGTP